LTLREGGTRCGAGGAVNEACCSSNADCTRVPNGLCLTAYTLIREGNPTQSVVCPTDPDKGTCAYQVQCVG
jgi:hypothetical protein